MEMESNEACLEDEIELTEIKNEEECNSSVEKVKFECLSNKYGEVNSKLPPFPDGGWGWLVVVSAFIITACVSGVASSLGLLQGEFARYFESSYSKLSLISIVFSLTPLFSGLIMSVLVDKFGCRVMTIVAGLLSTIGFLLAAISDSVEMLCLTYGVISGLAIGILKITAIVSVVYWFDKKRNLAVSLVLCSIHVSGSFVYSSLTNYLLGIFDWRNTVVILAGTLLNTCVCGAVMRDPDWLIIKQKRRLTSEKSIKISRDSSRLLKSSGGESSLFMREQLKDLMQNGKSPEYILHTLATTIAEAEKLEVTTKMNSEQNRFKLMHSCVHLPTFVQRNEKVPMDVIRNILINKSLYNIILRNHHGVMTKRKSQKNFSIQNNEVETRLRVNDPVITTVKINKTDKNTESTTTEGTIKLSDNRKMEFGFDIDEAMESVNTNTNFKRGNSSNVKTDSELVFNNQNLTRNLSVDKNEQDLNWFVKTYLDQPQLADVSYKYNSRIMGVTLNLPNDKPHAISLPNIYQNPKWSLGCDDERTWYRKLWYIILKIYDLRMFNELHFMMLILSIIILSTWVIVPYYYLLMNESNLEYGSVMISVINFTCLLGILVLGRAGDKRWINIPKVYTFCVIICGLSVACYPLSGANFWALVVISSIFGFTSASFYSYKLAMILEMMPVDHFTVAYGLVLFSEGIGYLIGPLLTELLIDISEMWELTVFVGGFWIVVSGLCAGVIAYTKNIKIFGTGPLLKDIVGKTRGTEVPFHV